MGRYVELKPHILRRMLMELLKILCERSSLDAYDEWELFDIKAWLDEASRRIKAYVEDRRRQEHLGAWMEK